MPSDPTIKLDTELRVATNAMRRAETAAARQSAQIAALKAEVSSLTLAVAERDAQIRALTAEIERLKVQPAPTAPPVVAPPVQPPVVTAPPVASELQWGEDATRDLYSRILDLPWAKALGDWTDAAGALYGSVPFASADLPKSGTESVVEIDVTELVRQHGADFVFRRNGGKSGGIISREGEAGKRPALIVTKGGQAVELSAIADAHLAASTSGSLGDGTTLALSQGPILMRFDQGAEAVDKAVLRLTASARSMAYKLEVYRPTPQIVPLADPAPADGTAADVVLDLKALAWSNGKKPTDEQDARHTLNADGSFTITIPTGKSSGAGKVFVIPADKRQPVMFARMVMTLHDDFTPNMGGKLPGLSNTGMGEDRENQGGWGGRTANGTAWSARTNRHPVAPGARLVGFNSYAYRLNKHSFNGEGVSSIKALPLGKTFVLDQMVKLNSVNADGTVNDDGEVTYWLNGECVNRMTGVRWRNHAGPDTLPSEFWLDVYIGGKGYQAPHPHSVTFHEVKVSTKRLPFDPATLDRLNGVQ